KGPQLTLLFDRWEIKEGTPAANKRFNQYNTTVKEAFIQESLDNKALHNSTTTQTNNSTATNNDTRVQDFFAGVAATVAAAILYLIH
ncbi:MAG TPA: hypothetical protein VLG50_03190, partial [Candidatus Saccharimonadales bacterium]|nr:hypothetical protein [Candidatus Saccharimonadales bacterium]